MVDLARDFRTGGGGGALPARLCFWGLGGGGPGGAFVGLEG